MSMSSELEAVRRMTKRRVERIETYCVMRSCTSSIVSAKTMFETE